MHTRRLVRRLVVVAGLAWAVAALLLVLSGAQDLHLGRRAAEQARAQLDPAGIRSGAAVVALGVAEDRFDRGGARLDHPLVLPLHVLPVIGRQLRSATALADAAERVAGVSRRSIEVVAPSLEEPPSDGPSRLRSIRRLGDASRTALAGLEGISLGPERGLVRPLANARSRLDAEIQGARRQADRAVVATSALDGFLRGPRRYLLVAANNGEMRAGSGMFLSVGVLQVEGGRLALGGMTPAGELEVPPPGASLSEDLEERWGWTNPGQEWRNLAMTPRFEATAPVAAEMWRARTGETVDGVMVLDVVALEAVLASTGAVEIDDLEIDADNVRRHLLFDQYAEIRYDDDLDATQTERRERLGDIAAAAVDRLEAGGIDLPTLAEGLSRAAAGRHVLLWSNDPDEQSAWQAVGVDGRLAETSLMVSLLNRGGNKLDQFLRVTNDVSTSPRDDGRTEVAVRIRVRNEAPVDAPPYVAGPNPALEGAVAGTYRGIIAINVPGPATDVSFGSSPTVVAGADGPSRVVGTQVTILRDETLELVATFLLPAGVDELVVEPSARAPASRWTHRADRWRDDAVHRLALAS